VNLSSLDAVLPVFVAGELLENKKIPNKTTNGNIDAKTLPCSCISIL
jgi:hypothetical protein